MTISPGSGASSSRIAVPGSPDDQHAAHRARVADAERGIAAVALGRRAVGEVGPVAFHGVDHRQAGGAEPLDQPLHRRHDRRDAADVVAEAGAEAAGLGEVALHVDDDQRHGLRLEGEGEGLRVDLRHQ